MPVRRINASFVTIFGLVAIMLLALMVGVKTPAHADGPRGNSTQSEVKGCLGDQYTKTFTSPLKRKGKSYRDIGWAHVLVRPGPGKKNARVCAIMNHGEKTQGVKLTTQIGVGTRAAKGGPISLRYYDRKKYAWYTEGRAITPSKKRCAVVVGYVVYKGRTYSITLTEKQLKVCN